MGVTPDFEIEGRERHGLVVGDPENADIRELAKPAADKDRVGKCRVVIPGEDHDPKIGNGEEIAGALKNDLAQLIIFEGVAGQQNDVGAQHPGSSQHRAQARRPVTVMRARRMVLVDMQVRTVDEDDFFVHRQSYSVRLGRQQRRHMYDGGTH